MTTVGSQDTTGSYDSDGSSKTLGLPVLLSRLSDGSLFCHTRLYPKPVDIETHIYSPELYSNGWRCRFTSWRRHHPLMAKPHVLPGHCGTVAIHNTRSLSASLFPAVLGSCCVAAGETGVIPLICQSQYSYASKRENAARITLRGPFKRDSLCGITVGRPDGREKR